MQHKPLINQMHANSNPLTPALTEFLGDVGRNLFQFG